MTREQVLAKAQAIAKSAVVQLIADVGGEREHGTLRVVKGHASHVIPEIVDTEQIDLVVMGSVARSGVAGLLVGNTAEAILEQLSCSVLTVKPDGFVSPVQLP